MICPECGVDHHPADAGGADEIAEAVVESAEIEAAADIERAEIFAETEGAQIEASTERAEIDAGAAVAIAEAQADAAVSIAEAQADAAVAIAEADAAALAEALATEAPPGEGEPAEAFPVDDDGVLSVAVPPQPDEPLPAGVGGSRARTVSAFRARRQRR